MVLRDYIHRCSTLILKKLSLIIYYLSNTDKLNNQRLLEIKNSHKGTRAFIVCNGPSLNIDDLNKLHELKEITFASNKIDKIFSQTKWRPTYYTIMDETYQFSLLDTMNSVPSVYKFFRKESYYTTRKVKGDCIFLNTVGGKELLKACKFSADCNKVLYTAATVTYAMLQLAVYMGIQEIHIIGCDNSYGIERQKDGSIINTGQVSYFNGSDKKDQQIPAAVWQMNIAYECAKQYAESHNIRIFNATRGGHLEIFKRKNFDSLFTNQ